MLFTIVPSRIGKNKTDLIHYTATFMSSSSRKSNKMFSICFYDYIYKFIFLHGMGNYPKNMMK